MTKFLLILLTISVKLGFASSNEGLEPEGESLSNLQSIAAALSDIESEPEAAYNESVEYYRHCQASKRFFRRLSKNPRAREIMTAFRAEITTPPPAGLTRISLDGFSSRTRILLFRELTAAIKGQNKTIPLHFHGQDFSLALNTSLRQPGDGVISSVQLIASFHCSRNPLFS